jgi:hypothetical protein
VSPRISLFVACSPEEAMALVAADEELQARASRIMTRPPTDAELVGAPSARAVVEYDRPQLDAEWDAQRWSLMHETITGSLA